MHYKTVRLSQFFDGDEITFTFTDEKVYTGTVLTVHKIGDEWWYSVWFNDRTIIISEDSIIDGKTYDMFGPEKAWKGWLNETQI